MRIELEDFEVYSKKCPLRKLSVEKLFEMNVSWRSQTKDAVDVFCLVKGNGRSRTCTFCKNLSHGKVTCLYHT